MSDPEIEMRVVDGKQAVDDTTIDYIPFGVKVLKLQIRKMSGPAKKVWIRTKHFKRDQDPCTIYGYADDGEDLMAVWGAGDIMGFCAKYTEQGGTKKAVLLDDDEPHTIYLHLVHRPPDPSAHQPQDRQLTVVAVITDDDVNKLASQECEQRQHHDRTIAEKTLTLTVPAGAANPIRPVWSWGQPASQITFSGETIPRYVSRWWPSRQVAYAPVDDPPRVTLAYTRSVKGDEGAINVWLGEGDGRQHLAQVSGHLTLPLHDLRLVVPELYRFYDDRLYVLRLWFFWTDEHINADDLLTFVPAAQQDALRPQATQEAADLMKSKLWGRWPGWGKQYEIPDAERFDIVFDPGDLTLKYGCTDAHWKEFWSKVEGQQAFHGSIAAPKQAISIVFNHLLDQIKHLGQEPKPITNPLEEGGVAALVTKNRCRYCRHCAQIVCAEQDTLGARCPRCDTPFEVGQIKAPGLAGKNAPKIENGALLPDGLSSDVLEEPPGA